MVQVEGRQFRAPSVFTVVILGTILEGARKNKEGERGLVGVQQQGENANERREHRCDGGGTAVWPWTIVKKTRKGKPNKEKKGNQPFRMQPKKNENGKKVQSSRFEAL